MHESPVIREPIEYICDIHELFVIQSNLCNVMKEQNIDQIKQIRRTNEGLTNE